ncbi:hypothetical protein QQX10_11065 [Demequina sp. SYSU T00039]|nr:MULTISPECIES: hypothetical protein [unclassified Demequina]MDN4478729.1 hypothetical protein [Demequina sp. SYSU T00039-1]MDN4488706.1 hypothetical protein [Demequina sp. SYSU T00039]MDN4491688.1 hypothetical protein [Demequina sp. SYSU T00068]
MRGAGAARGLVALVVAVALAACGGGPAPPVIDEKGAGADGGGDDYGAVEVIDGRVVDQVGGYGEPVEASGSDQLVAPQTVLLSVDTQGGSGVVRVELVRGYVALDATAEPVPPIDLPDEVLRFTVRQRSDGVYVCGVAPCITRAE